MAIPENEKMRIVQEHVPGKQVTLAHIIAHPDPVLYVKLGLVAQGEVVQSAIGIVTVTPAETAVIAADLAIKSSGAELGFVDRFSGTLIICGSVSQIESALAAICAYTKDKLGYTVCDITKT